MEPLKSSKQSFAGSLKGRIFRPFLYGLLSTFPATGICTENQKLSIQFESTSYSEATSLRSLSGEWNDRVTSGDDAFSVNRFRVGYEDDSYSIQYLQRIDILFEYANDTARFLYQTDNQLSLTPGEPYRLYIREKSSVSHGIRLGYKKRLAENFSVATYFSLLSPTNLERGYLDGSAVAIAPNDYDFNFSSDVFYREDPLYGRDSELLSGNGYAWDLNFRYAINERWYATLDLLDVAGKLFFDNAPFTTADATSDVKTFDENGYVIYNPVITGLEGNKDFTYEFDMESHLAIFYAFSDKYSFALQHHQYKNVAYQEIQFIQSINVNNVSWHLIPELEAVGVSYLSPNFTIGITADDLDFKKTKYLALYGQYFWPF